METTIRIAAAATTAAAAVTMWCHGNGWITLDGRQLGSVVIIALASVAVYFGARALSTTGRRL
jgi:hypothetical protein